MGSKEVRRFDATAQAPRTDASAPVTGRRTDRRPDQAWAGFAKALISCGPSFARTRRLAERPRLGIGISPEASTVGSRFRPLPFQPQIANSPDLPISCCLLGANQAGSGYRARKDPRLPRTCRPFRQGNHHQADRRTCQAGERNPDLLCEGALKKLREIIQVAPTRRCRATGRGWPPPPFLEGSVQGTH